MWEKDVLYAMSGHNPREIYGQRLHNVEWESASVYNGNTKINHFYLFCLCVRQNDKESKGTYFTVYGDHM